MYEDEKTNQYDLEEFTETPPPPPKIIIPIRFLPALNEGKDDSLDNSEDDVIWIPPSSEMSSNNSNSPLLPDYDDGGNDYEDHMTGIGAKMLYQMGYEPGKGLGKNLQGISEPLKVNGRLGRGAIGAYGPEKSIISKYESSLPKIFRRYQRPLSTMTKNNNLTRKIHFHKSKNSSETEKNEIILNMDQNKTKKLLNKLEYMENVKSQSTTDNIQIDSTNSNLIYEYQKNYDNNDVFQKNEIEKDFYQNKETLLNISEDLRSQFDVKWNVSIISENHPQQKLSEKNFEEIESYLSNCIISCSEIEQAAHVPIFHKMEFTAGIIKLICANQSTKDWLFNLIKRQNLHKILALETEDLIKQNFSYKFWLSGPKIELELALKTLQFQNKHLRTKYWKIISSTYMTEFKLMLLTANLDWISIDALREVDFKPFYRLGRAKVELIKKL